MAFQTFDGIGEIFPEDSFKCSGHAFHIIVEGTMGETDLSGAV